MFTPLANKADINAKAHDLPSEAATGVLFTQAHDVIHLYFGDRLIHNCYSRMEVEKLGNFTLLILND